MVKNLPAGFDPYVGKIPGERNGNPLQYSCLGNFRTEEADRLQPIELQSVGHFSAFRV